MPKRQSSCAKVVETEAGKVLAGYIPGGLERSFEEFAQLRAEQTEDAKRGGTAAEINEKYDSAFVGPPLLLAWGLLAERVQGPRLDFLECLLSTDSDKG